MLAQHGADPRARDDAGATPLDRATEGGWEDNVRVLTDLTTDG
jgi:ankyrin repeat protein